MAAAKPSERGRIVARLILRRQRRRERAQRKRGKHRLSHCSAGSHCNAVQKVTSRDLPVHPEFLIVGGVAHAVPKSGAMPKFLFAQPTFSERQSNAGTQLSTLHSV